MKAPFEAIKMIRNAKRRFITNHNGWFAGDLAASIRKRTTIKFGLYHCLLEFCNPLYVQDKAGGFKTQTFLKVRIYFLVVNISKIYVVLFKTGDVVVLAI